MLCPCGGHLIVKDSRSIAEGYWRRRRCTTCLTEYTTVEQFCVTERGTPGRQPQVKVPPAPRVQPVRTRKAKLTPAVTPSPPVAFSPRPSVRKKLEDLRAEKELQKSNSAGWD